MPTLQLSHLSPTQKRAYILADNRLAEKAGWDKEILAVELQGLLDDGFEVIVTGFEVPEVDVVLDRAAEAKPCFCQCSFMMSRSFLSKFSLNSAWTTSCPLWLS